MTLFYLFLIVVAVILFLIVSRILQKQRLIRFFSGDYADWDQKEISSDRLEITKRYWKQIQGHKKNSHSIDDMTWNDLDMDVLYGKINITQSSCGAEVLYSQLREISFDSDKLTEFQKLIQLFQAEKELKVNSLIQLFYFGDQDSLRLFDFLFKEEKLEQNSIFLYYFLRAFLFLSIFSIIFLPIEVAGLLIILSMSTNVLLYYVKRKMIIKDLIALQYLSGLVKCAKKISTFAFPDNISFKEELTVLVKELSILSDRLALSSGQAGGETGVFIEYFRILLLLDFTVYYRASAFIQKHQVQLQELYQLVGTIDSAIALGEYQQTLPFTCNPEFVKEDTIIVDQLYHPLIENAVLNSIDWKENMIITGSNASGKSTYVKAMAIGLIFAQTVGFSFARKLVLSPAMVITSMAVRDSIEQNESYFIAEIKSLKRIIDQLNDKVRYICFIDEILKGTNTIERIAASAAILNYLSTKNCLVAVASHDIELTEIMSKSYQNYHFSEIVTDNEIKFDYKLQFGPTKTHNAILLLDYLDYQKSIIKEANSLAETYREKRVWQIVDSQ